MNPNQLARRNRLALQLLGEPNRPRPELDRAIRARSTGEPRRNWPLLLLLATLFWSTLILSFYPMNQLTPDETKALQEAAPAMYKAIITAIQTVGEIDWRWVNGECPPDLDIAIQSLIQALPK